MIKPIIKDNKPCKQIENTNLIDLKLKYFIQLSWFFEKNLTFKGLKIFTENKRVIEFVNQIYNCKFANSF